MNSRFEAQDAARARAGVLAVARELRPLPPAGGKTSKDVESPAVSFPDPVGDAGPGPDISRVEISPVNGDEFEFAVTVTRHQRCAQFGSPDGPMILIDRDQNPDTGSAYYGAEVALTSDDEGISQLLRAHGWDLRRVPRSAGFGESCNAHGFEVYVSRETLGLGPGAGFNVVVAAVGPRTDTAPDVGTFNYQQVRGKVPPKPKPDTRAPHIAGFYAERPSSRTVRLGYWVLDDRGAIGETFRVYRGRRLLATIRRPVRESNPFEFAYLYWRVPRGVRGPLRFTLRAVDAAGNRSRLSSATG